MIDDMDPQSVDWDDLRILTVIAREESLRAAAAKLRMSHATVSRHLASLQERLGVRLFERDGRRLRPTEAGVDVIESAERLALEIDSMALRIAGGDLELSGTVRVAMPPSLLRVLAPAVAALTRSYSEIRLEFATGLELSNFTRRQADIAVRITSAPPVSLIGRKVGHFGIGVYVGADFDFAYGIVDDKTEVHARDLPWIDWDERYGAFPPARWLAENVPASAIRATADTEVALLDLVAAGVGAAFLPHVLAADDARFTPVNVQPVPAQLGHDIWVLTHADLRSSGRVRAVMKALGDYITTHQERFAPTLGANVT